LLGHHGLDGVTEVVRNGLVGRVHGVWVPETEDVLLVRLVISAMLAIHI
jgi:hypothetical protein